MLNEILGRGQVAEHTFIDDSPFQRDQYVSESPYTTQELFVAPRSRGKTICVDEVDALLSNNSTLIRAIDINSKRELHIPSEAFPKDVASEDIEVSINKNMQLGTVGFVRVNGIEYPILNVESCGSGIGANEDLLFCSSDEKYNEGSFREPTIDAFNQLRPGYKGGNTPNIFKSMEPCSKVNPKDVAKRRAKNKAARKNKRK